MKNRGFFANIFCESGIDAHQGTDARSGETSASVRKRPKPPFVFYLMNSDSIAHAADLMVSAR
jgi:hypothetical protein